MNVTSEDYIAFKKNIVQRYKNDPKSIRALMEEVATKHAMELEIVEKHGMVCPLGKLTEARMADKSIDWKKLKNAMGEQFYNIEVLESVACAVDSLLYVTPSIPGGATIGTKAKEIITNLHRIGAPSVGGYALAADVGGEKDFMVIKVPQDPKRDDLVHEYVVGSHLNRLRASIPSFAGMLACVRGPPPKISPTGEVLNWHDTEKDGSRHVPYVIYENIAPSITMAEYVSTGDTFEFISGYLQVLLALMIANYDFDYTHYDLHSKNVLARRISHMGFTDSSAFQIKFPLPNGEDYYIKSNVVMTIIDYGSNFIKITEPEFGDQPIGFGIDTVDLITVAQFPNHSWYLYDPYKLLMFCMKNANSAGNKQVLEIGEKIFRFFNKTEDMVDCITKQYPQRYALPYTTETVKYTMMDLFNHILQNVKETSMIISKPNSIFKDFPLLSCNGHCLTFNALINSDKGISQHQVPTTFMGLYDSMATGHHYSTEEGQRTLMGTFDYKNALNQFASDIESLVIKINNEASMSKNVIITRDTTIDYQFLTLVRSQYANIFKLKMLIEEMELKVKIGNWVSKKYNDPILSKFVEAAESQVKIAVGIYCEISGNAIHNYEIIHGTMSLPQWNKLIVSDSRLLWFRDHAGDIMSIDNKRCPMGYNIKKQVRDGTSAKPRFPSEFMSTPIIKTGSSSFQSFPSPPSSSFQSFPSIPQSPRQGSSSFPILKSPLQSPLGSSLGSDIIKPLSLPSTQLSIPSSNMSLPKLESTVTLPEPFSPISPPSSPTPFISFKQHEKCDVGLGNLHQDRIDLPDLSSSVGRSPVRFTYSPSSLFTDSPPRSLLS